MIPRPRLSLLLLAGILACTALAGPTPALAVSDDPVLQRMDTVLEENTRLREEAWKAHKSQNRETARQAAEAAAASDERLERIRTEALAHVAGVSPVQVDALRKDGKSWGQAAGELGVHPGFLGIGKVPMYEPQTARKAKKTEAGEQAGKRGKQKLKGKEPEAKDKAAKASVAKDKEPAKASGKTKSTGKTKGKKEQSSLPAKKTKNGPNKTAPKP
jgi:hypothetical protein